MTLNNGPYTVIGVMPEGSKFDRTSARFWRPLAFSEAERARNSRWFLVVGRLKPGVTLQQARAEMDTIGARIAREYPDSNKGWSVSIERLSDVIVGPQLRRSLYVLLVAVGMLLLIACANLANLTLARGTSREREVAVVRRSARDGGASSGSSSPRASCLRWAAEPSASSSATAACARFAHSCRREHSRRTRSF
jgi:putative ABC transport system permease protein